MATGIEKQNLRVYLPANNGSATFLYYARMLSVCWLLLVGLWSAPAFGAELVYPNYLLQVEIFLAFVLLLCKFQGKVLRLTRYPFLYPSIIVLIIATVAALLRVFLLRCNINQELFHLAQHGEPLLRASLIFFALAGDRSLLRIAWFSALFGLMLNALASVIQHFTQVARWYNDLDRGWRDGWSLYRGIPAGEDVRYFSPRTQGLTSYTNTTAAFFAASLPYWIMPVIMREKRRLSTYSFFISGILLTSAGLCYTHSRGPLLALILVIFLLASFLPWRWSIALICANITLLLTIILPSVRLALGEFIAAVLLAVLAHLRRWKYTWPLICVLAIYGGIISIDGYLLHFNVNNRIVEQGVDDQSREILYINAIKTTLSSPWIGAGEERAGAHILHLPNAGLQELPRSKLNYHNSFLHWAAVEGIPLALAMTLFTIGAVVWCWRAFRRATTPFSRSLTLATTIGMTIYLLCNLVDAHFWRMEGASFFWSLLALTAATARSEDEEFQHVEE